MNQIFIKLVSYAKDSYEAKYLFLITEHVSICLKHCNHFKAIIEYSNGIQDVESIEVLKITIQKRKSEQCLII